MRATIICCCIWVAYTPPSNAQIDAPNQFYTNGVRIDGWTRDETAGEMVSLWFGKNPKDSLSYRQLKAIIKDDTPDKILYYDLVARRFVGRYDLKLEKYSLLRPSDRKERLEDITEGLFPPAGEKPPIGELFDPPMDGQPNDDILMKPPVTMMFPELENSEWDAYYTTAAGERIRVNVRLNGRQGTYRSVGWNEPAVLRDVQYSRRENGHAIQGRWALGQSNGFFLFRIPMDNLGAFEGDWGFNRGQVDGIWDGKRSSR